MRTLIVVLLVAGLSACGGGGGDASTNSIVTPIVSTSPSSAFSSSSSAISTSSTASSTPKAIPVEKTSYLNKLKFGDPNHGKAYIMANAKGKSTRPVAYGDFLQDGSITAISVDYLENYNITAEQWPVSRLYFFKQVGTTWVDVTSKLLKDTTGCQSLKKASIADYNNDGRPDLFLGCTGADTTGGAGESQRILISQTDGTYLNMQLPFVCYCHASTAGDINADGNIDIVVYDNLSIDGHYPHPIALLGNGDGTFTEDITRFNKLMDSKPIFTFDLIDTGNRVLDLMIGGYGSKPGYVGCDCNFENSIGRNDGNGNFKTLDKIDNSLGMNDDWYDIAIDFIVKDGYLYLNQVGSEYYASVVRKIDLSDLTKSSIIYEVRGTEKVGPGTWFPWLAVLSNGAVASMCDYSDVTSSWCNWNSI